MELVLRNGFHYHELPRPTTRRQYDPGRLRVEVTDGQLSPQTFGLMHCGSPSASPERNNAREALGLFFSVALVRGQGRPRCLSQQRAGTALQSLLVMHQVSCHVSSTDPLHAGLM